MKSYLPLVLLLTACAAPNFDITPKGSEPVVSQSWDAVRIGTYDAADFARLFTEIGNYEIVSQDGTHLTLQQNGVGAVINLDTLPRSAPQARPPDAKAWEPGCYWSLMMRAKNIPSIIEDAAPLGWLPRTPMAYLEFGPSKLNIVVLTHQETGAQVQLYERLTTPLPENYPPFERFGVPFNIMQMARDRDASYEFFTQALGFSTFYHGDPSLSEEPEIMPLGLPVELTTTVPYVASIVSPIEGMEMGRFEMIQIMGKDAGLSGRDFSNQCNSGSVGLTTVIYTLSDAQSTEILTSPDGTEIMLRAK